MFDSAWKKPFDRRRLLLSARASLASCAVAGQFAQARARTPKSRFGLLSNCCNNRARYLKQKQAGFDLFKPVNYLEHCLKLGVNGMQVGLGVMDSEESKTLRSVLEENDAFVEAKISAPFKKSELDRFEAEVRSAVSVGATAARTTIIPGRRYERFDNIKEYQEFATRGAHALELATPIMERHKLPLAVENHKDQQLEERIRLFEKLDSEFIGACVDTGNSMALLEDAVESARAFAPWAFVVHLKDQAVGRYPDGFLLGDIPLGGGAIDLPKVVDALKSRKPGINFCLELITRDPLKVPVLTDGYWQTFPQLPGKQLARMLKFVNEHRQDNLPIVSKMSADQRVALEDRNIATSIEYARRVLGILS